MTTKRIRLLSAAVVSVALMYLGNAPLAPKARLDDAKK